MEKAVLTTKNGRVMNTLPFKFLNLRFNPKSEILNLTQRLGITIPDAVVNLLEHCRFHRHQQGLYRHP